MKEFAVYTAARLGIFLLSYGLIVAVYLLVTGSDQVPLFWPFLLAVLISAVASVTLLRKQRDAFAAAVRARAVRSATRRRMVAEHGGPGAPTGEQESSSEPEDPGR